MNQAVKGSHPSEDKAMASDNQSKNIDSVSKEVIWEITNCSTRFFTEYENGKFFSSEPFYIYKDNMCTKWRLDLYPNGKREKRKSNIGIYLIFDVNGSSELVDFDVKVMIKIVSNKNEKSMAQGGYQKSRKEFDELPGYGYHLLSHLRLDDDGGFINDRKLKINVKITVEFKVETNKPEPSIMQIEHKAKTKILSDLGKMFDNEALTDFEIKTNDGEVFKGHKVILAARSPIFYAMLTTEMKETTSGSCDILDFNSKVMKEVLRFIYCGEVKNLNDLASDLIFAAEKYQLEELKAACMQNVISSLNPAVEPEVLIKFLNVAHQVSEADELFEKCLDLIVSDFPDVTKSLEWKELPHSLVSKIAENMIRRCKFNTLNLSTDAK